MIVANPDHIRIKICGIRSVDVALACAGAGADFLGFNFAPVSRRRTDPATASRAIEALKTGGPRLAREAALDHLQATSHTPHSSTPFAVGIFVNQSAREIDDIARECGLDIVQLSGTETPEECEAIAATTRLPLIKVVRLTSASDHEPINAYGSLPNLFALTRHMGGHGRTLGLRNGPNPCHYLHATLVPCRGPDSRNRGRSDSSRASLGGRCGQWC